MAPGWTETFQHLLAESERLGMQIHLNNDIDWSCKALPWMTLEHAQKRIVRTATPVSGGQRIRTTLPRAEINDKVFKLWSELYTPKGETPPVNTYYRDNAVLAVRSMPGSKPLPRQGPESGLVWDTQPFGLKTGEVNCSLRMGELAPASTDAAKFRRIAGGAVCIRPRERQCDRR